MTVHATYEVLARPVPATDALRREPLLDPFVCGVREVEQHVVHLRISVLDHAGGTPRLCDAAYYPATGEFGVTTAEGRVTWLIATSVDAAIARWTADAAAT